MRPKHLVPLALVLGLLGMAMIFGISQSVKFKTIQNPPPTRIPAIIPTSPSLVNSGLCDSTLWNHVYHPQRLGIIEQCKTVTGTIDFIRKEADGDDHVGLKLDPGQENLLTPGNIQFERGDLILEPVCEEPVTQSDAISACQGFHSNVVVPLVGTHVKVTGTFVFDTVHQPVHNEIHPVTSITTF